MPTGYLESSAAVFSAISLNGSGATLDAGAVVASTISVSGAITISGATISPSAVRVASGAAIGPTVAFTSEVSLGFYRSAASVAALSYGFLSAPGLISSVTTAQSASSAKVTQQGQIIFSILSLTTNGAAMYYRSGNSVYGWPSSLAVG